MAQLENLGLEFEAIPPQWEEESLKKLALPPDQLAQTLATQKARSRVDHFPNDIVVGGDQVVVWEGRLFNKPGSPEKAVEHLKSLAGQTHQLFTAITLMYKGQVWKHTDTTHLSMRPLSEEVIRAYIKRDDPINCAGAYKLESAGMALFRSIQTKDPSAITGIPLIKLVDILLEIGYPLKFTIPTTPLKE